MNKQRLFTVITGSSDSKIQDNILYTNLAFLGLMVFASQIDKIVNIGYF